MEIESFNEIDKILLDAYTDGRQTLYEHEVYGVLTSIGISVPEYVFIRDISEVNAKMIAGFSTPFLILKTVSRDMAHNQRYGGVKKVANSDPLFVKYVLTSMKDEVLSHFSEDDKPRIDGFLIIEFVKFTQAIGSEIMIGLKEDPAFGAVVTLTKGGDDAEFFAKYYDAANLCIAPISYEDASNITGNLKIRHKYEEAGHPEYLDKLAVALSTISHLGHNYSFMSPRSPRFHINVLDINPLVFSEDGRFLAIDGYAEFEEAKTQGQYTTMANTSNLGAFFKPRGVAILGVSSVAEKYSMARVILTLFIDMGRTDIYCVNPKGGEAEIAGKTYTLYKNLSEIPGDYDLVIYAAPAKNTLKFLESVPDDKAVILISGIPPELDYSGFIAATQKRSKGVRLIGPNCMGVFQAPDGANLGVNTLFIDESRLQIPYTERSNTALFTQSGAMGITTIERAQHSHIIRTIVSFGNKSDVNIPDLMAYFENENSIDVMALYIEGISPGEGRQFFDLAGKSRKPIIVYKSGRTQAGAIAAASHTASMSGSYDVFKAACEQSGCVLTEDLEDFYNYTKAFALLCDKKVSGKRVAGVVNAGLDATMGADTLHYIEQTTLSDDTISKISLLNSQSHGLVNINTSFLDVTPMTGDTLYASFVEAVIQDENVDCLFVAIVPHIENLKTVESDYRDPDAVVVLLCELASKTDKPIVVSVNSGSHYQHLVAYLEEHGIPVYSNIHAAIRSLDAFVEYRMERRILGS
jgi:acyl-CoA synthetase (NDP forming)